jgi:hypothetical protein
MSYKYNIRTGLTKVKTKVAIGVSGVMLLLGGTGMSLFLVGSSHAASNTYTLTPWTFVGAAGDCGTGYPAGTGPVVSKWDNSTGNPAPSLRLEKNAPTTDCSAAGASVNGVNGITLTELNFDYKGYCGAGAPRFNVVTNDNVTHFVGCASGVATPTGNGYTHVVFDPTNPAQAFPVITPGETVKSIDIVQDEMGQVNIDNVSINEQIIGAPNTPANKDACKKDGWMTAQRADGTSFKNQGDCVSYTNNGR